MKPIKYTMKIHLGAFDQSVEGWINTDITPHIWIAKIPFLSIILYKMRIITRKRYIQHKDKVFKGLKYLNLIKPLPFQSNSVEAVFSSHVFEHLFMYEVESLIGEIYRILVPGGICRVVVPDLEKTLGNYDREDPRKFIDDLFENSKRRSIKNAHHSAFTGPFLVRLFNKAGFSDAAILSYRVGKCPDLNKLDNRSESLFFEAVK